MEEYTGVSIFSGSGLADIGLSNAGVSMVGAVELNKDIADCYSNNLPGHMVVSDISNVNPCDYKGVDVLWASPPCQAHSMARSKSLKPREDAELGLHVCNWVECIRPKYVFVENVPKYKEAASFKSILITLLAHGYSVQHDVLNASDYGVPQDRKRLILRAIRHGAVPRYIPTVPRHNGWYNAVADIIDTFKPSPLANWQIERLTEVYPQGITACCLIEPDASGARPPTVRTFDKPAYTLKTSGGGRVHRVFLGKPFQDWKKDTVALSMRALARLQTLPDWYVLPEKKTLAATIIGNGVPCLFSETIARYTLEGLE